MAIDFTVRKPYEANFTTFFAKKSVYIFLEMQSVFLEMVAIIS